MMSSSSLGAIWPWATATFTSGTVSARKARCSLEIADPRADVEALPAAIALAQQRLAHHQAVERRR